MTKKIYLINTITNLHVGSGDSDYGLVDNKVQRDVITGYPTINSSSLKGALRSKAEATGNTNILTIFGGEEIISINDNGEKTIKKSKKGKFIFYSAKLLFIPARSTKKPYYLVTCPKILEEFKEILELFGLKDYFPQNFIINEGYVNISNENEDIEIEEFVVKNSGIHIKKSKIKEFREEFVILSDENFSELVENLPIIARNHLDNGESKNLWYEEIVPRKSIFYFGVDMGTGNNYDKEFDRILEGITYIGGNVSVGYGVCEIMEVKE